MLEAFNPVSTTLAKPFVATLSLTDQAESHLDSGANVRRYLDRLLADGLSADALVVIAHALPVQMSVAWCCECVRSGIAGTGPAVEAERAAVKLAEQCLQEPTDDLRKLCLEFAERAKRRTAGAWLATAAAWADSTLTPPGDPHQVPAPPEAIAAAVVAALRLAASGAGSEEAARLQAFATRALAVFGPRAGKN